MDVFEYWGMKMVYQFVLAVFSAPLIGLAVFIVVACGGKDAPELLRDACILASIVWVVVLNWLAGRAATRKVTQVVGFWGALEQAFGDARLFLMLLPVIGRLFARKREG